MAPPWSRFRFRLRISTLLWLVVIVAAFFGGMRYEGYQEAHRKQQAIRLAAAAFKFQQQWLAGVPAQLKSRVGNGTQKADGGAVQRGAGGVMPAQQTARSVE